MNRCLVFAGTIAVALLAPAATLAAPSGAIPVRGAPVARPVTTHSSESAHSATDDRFKVPFDVDVRPRSLPEAQSTYFAHGYGWHGSQATPTVFLYQPAWYQSACYTGNPLGMMPASFAPASSNSANPYGNVSIGSLVDQQSHDLFSTTPSHNANLASSSGSVAASSPFSLQYEFHTTPCGTANVFSL